MNQHHDEHHGWVQDAERWICQLQAVRQCKIDLDAAGNVSGIHVVSTDERDPRHVVRDVEGLLKARLGLDVYYKKIGVVQVIDPVDEDEDGPPEREAVSQDPPQAAVPEPRPEPAPAAARRAPDPVPFPVGDGPRAAVIVEEPPLARVECAGLGLMVSGANLTATVELVRGEASAQGRAAGPNQPGMDQQILARAAVQALENLLGSVVQLSVADVRPQETAGEPLLVVAVDLVEGRRSERFFGLCRTRPNPQQAAVYAVLDALNRRLELMDARGELLAQED
ncbi:MAG TPA: hypothetical protein P5571_06985 [Candidatus Krumholzibacteria bacterium]|nr:hypothetical protein [Candidatus Krumholzibacteria bacterium]HRX51089.1 hypothetical protein [Candidatus Krumholzibacteria bacterium]